MFAVKFYYISQASKENAGFHSISKPRKLGFNLQNLFDHRFLCKDQTLWSIFLPKEAFTIFVQNLFLKGKIIGWHWSLHGRVSDSESYIVGWNLF